MDKITIALAATEDNAAAIREINKALSIRKGCRLLAGINTIGHTPFGTVESDGKIAVIVTFIGNSVTLEFCGSAVANATSPIIAILPEGKGVLRLTEYRGNAKALLIGGA